MKVGGRSRNFGQFFRWLRIVFVEGEGGEYFSDPVYFYMYKSQTSFFHHMFSFLTLLWLLTITLLSS